MKNIRWFIVFFVAGICMTGWAAVVANVTESISGTTVIPEAVTDFVVYDAGTGTVRKADGPNLISAISSDSPVSNDGSVGSLFTLQWSDGSPTVSGSSPSYQYVGFGSGFSPRATYATIDLVMPSTSGTFILWLVANPNGSTYNMQFDVTFGKEGDAFSGTYSTPSDAKAFQFEFDLSGFSVNDTLSFRVDNVSGNNP